MLTTTPTRSSTSYTIKRAAARASAWPSRIPLILATSSGTLVVAGGIVGGIARIVAVLLGVEGVTGAVSRPGGVEDTRGVSTAVRLRLVGDRCGPSETIITSFVG